MSKCFVLFCKSKGNIPGLSYFRITPARRESWLRAIGRDPRENYSESVRICSHHFLDEDKILKKNRIYLKPGAIPKLRLGPRKPLSFLHENVEQEIKASTSSLCFETDHLQETPSTSNVRYETVIEECVAEEVDLDSDDKENVSPICFSSSSSTVTCDSPMPKTMMDYYGTIHVICALLLAYTYLSNKIAPENPKHLRVSQLKRKASSPSSSSDSDGFRGPIKRARRGIKTFHSYCKPNNSLVDKLDKSVLKIGKTQEKLKSMRRRVDRLVTRVKGFKDILLGLKQKHMLSEDALSVLQKSYAGVPLTLLRRAIQNMKLQIKNKKQMRVRFPEELRSFALTLQFYSTKAYNYVRNVFGLALPALSTVRSWVNNVDCEPGFSDTSFSTLKKIAEKNRSANKQTLCALMLDEMAIKKHIEVRGNKTWGYEDFGTGIQSDNLKCAKDALVLMVVSVNSNWKIPISYYLINSLGGCEKANIVQEAIKRLHNIGIRVVSVTCDGPSAHFKMAEHLGANLKNINNIVPYFEHPVTSSKVYIIFDPCHMIKLWRNNWASLGKFIDKDGNEIDFKYIRMLAEVQEAELCRLGTKLKKSHLQWVQQKMKVNLAVQTLSASVADALEFLMKEHPDFKGAKATINFIRIIDRLFDLTNSRNPFGKSYKTPLRQENETFWKPKLLEGLEYLKTLKNVKGQFLHSTRNATPLRGYCINILSFLGIYEDLVKSKDAPLRYILGYKFSQDHLELFFCCMRGRNGWNNNPTAFQFFYTYKRLTLQHDIQTLTGNCSQLDDTSILTVSSSKRKDIISTIDIDNISLIKKYNIDINDFIMNESDFMGVINFLPTLSNISENVVTYIAGFVVKSIKKFVKCQKCLDSLHNTGTTRDDSCYTLLNIKDRGGLIKPEKQINEACFYIEKKIRLVLSLTNNTMPPEKNFINVFIKEVSMYLFENNFLSKIDNHIFDYPFENENHRMKVIKLISQIYAKIRFYNIAKKQTETIKGKEIRSKLNKLVLFSHQ